MDLSSMFSDDQLAVLGCLVALTACGLIAMVSYHVGPAGRGKKNNDRTTIPVLGARIRTAEKPQDRRAA